MAVHASQPNIVFIIDDNAERRLELKTIFDFMGQQTIVSDCKQWSERIINEQDLLTTIVSDSTEKASLNELVRAIKQCCPQKPITLIANQPATNLIKAELMHAITAVLQRPLKLDQIYQLIKMCQTFKARLPANLANQERDSLLFRSLVGLSTAAQRVRKDIDKVTKTTTNVLIIGEPNTGKQVLARNIHFLSAVKDNNFIAFDCSTMNIDIIEKLLFGHQHFMQYTPGAIEQADGSTLFIDEIDLLPLKTQNKLLDALNNKAFSPINSNKSVPFNARILAGSSQNLEALIKHELFREELYYCLSQFIIEMPALRHRIDDLPLLLNELVARLEATKKITLHFPGDTISVLRNYEWPNNLQELSELVEYLGMHFPNDIIGPEKLPSKFHAENLDKTLQASTLPDPNIIKLPETGVNLKEYLAKTEISIIKQALQHCNGVVARAAKHLNLRRTTLLEKMRRYELR